jgi:hypothetical protein
MPLDLTGRQPASTLPFRAADDRKWHFRDMAALRVKVCLSG